MNTALSRENVANVPWIPPKAFEDTKKNATPRTFCNLVLSIYIIIQMYLAKNDDDNQSSEDRLNSFESKIHRVTDLTKQGSDEYEPELIEKRYIYFLLFLQR